MTNTTPVIVRLLLNQFAMSLFGIMLTFSTIMVSDAFGAAVSFVAIFLYFYLTYNVMWDKGARDVISPDRDKKGSPAKGFLYSFLAMIPTVVLTVIFSVITVEMTNYSAFANSLYAFAKMVLMFAFQGMYHGFANLFGYHFVFYIICLFPAVIIGGISYMMGYKNIRIIPQKQDK